MKGWHLVLIVLVAYVIGTIYPGPLAMIRSKLGV